MESQDAIIQWVKTKIRITNKAIRDRWGVDEETADHIYKCLRTLKVIGRMGYVEREKR